MTEETEVAETEVKRGRKAKVACMVLRDFWTADDEKGGRVMAGTIIEVSPEEAMDGIEAGTLARVK